MPPRRAAAVSAASNLSTSSAAAGTSTSAPSTPVKSTAKGRASGLHQETKMMLAPVQQSLSPIVRRLRTMWKFAAVCQFLFTFDEAFGMSGFETEALELDLDGTERKVIPDLMRRLLYTLTLNRSIDETNWEDHLRAQYLARLPEENPLGSIEDPFPWAGLPLRQKIETLYLACEWQLWDAERFRKLVKNEEDAQVWRIDPIGWDSQDNTYWLFDDNRLWIQHPWPAPVKAKAPPKKNTKKAKLEAAAAKRAAQNSQKRKREEAKPKSTPTRTSARNRTSSDLVEEPAVKRGRTSRRSMGKDGWEEIPAGLLYDESRARDGDEDSELSDPPPAEETPSVRSEIKEEEDLDDGEEGEQKEEVDEGAEPMEVDEGEKVLETNGKTESEQAKEAVEEEWIEFETLAVSKEEWEVMATRFAKSKHPDEKLLHHFLKNEVLPKVMADIAEAEKQRAHEAAMANRKRSSRIALKESEREEKERDRVARLKMEGKMAAIRAEETQRALKEREEIDTAKMREERLREREERMAAREREAFERAERDIIERENREKMREMRKMKREQLLANGGLTHESEELQQHKEQDDDSWELRCDVCGKAGINLDDTDEIVCCEKCGVWQHTECWNAFDRRVGRPARDWEKEDFFCARCKPPMQVQSWPQVPTSQGMQGRPSMGVAASPAAAALVLPQQRMGVPQPATRPAFQAGYAPQQPQASISPGMYSNQVVQPRPAVVAYGPESASSFNRPGHGPGPSPMAGFQGQSNGHPRPVQPQADPRQPSSQVPISPQYMQRPLHVEAPPNRPAPQVTQVPNQPRQDSALPTQPTSVNGSAVTVPTPATLHKAGNGNSSLPPASMSTPHPASPSRQAAPVDGGLTAATSMKPPTTASSSSPMGPVIVATSSQSSPGAASAVTPPSPKASSSVPRSVASQPSGSFPLRHSTARSPLSRPDGYSPPSIPSMSLGPSIRATSPTLMKKSPSGAARTDALYNRQPISTPVSHPASSSPGPGPTTGSLARTSPQHAKTFGPSPARPTFGGSSVAANDTNPPSQVQGGAPTQALSSTETPPFPPLRPPPPTSQDHQHHL